MCLYTAAFLYSILYARTYTPARACQRLALCVSAGALARARKQRTRAVQSDAQHAWVHTVISAMATKISRCHGSEKGSVISAEKRQPSPTGVDWGGAQLSCGWAMGWACIARPRAVYRVMAVRKYHKTRA